MISKRDVLRPIVGLFLIQPIVLIWLYSTSDSPLDEYLQVGWGLQLLITIWLIPVYYYYERIFDFLENSVRILSFEDPKKSK
tara:strand:+ start:2702 stop:2947 length:246 start_codon:yes stop_codon:yes gene_type:complete